MQQDLNTDFQPFQETPAGPVGAPAPVAPVGAPAPVAPTSPVPPRTFGPITTPAKPVGTPAPVAPPATPAQTSEDRIVARLAAMMGLSQTPSQPQAAAFSSLSAEDQRLVSALSAAHPTGRDIIITSRVNVGTNLFFVMYGTSPNTGTRQSLAALVYDDGEMTHIFGGR